MKTFLNVGMNDEIAESFSRKDGYEWTAWDCYRRFFQSWGMVYGIDRDEFDQVMQSKKAKHGLELKIQFSPKQMKETCFAYEKVLNDHGIYIEKDPARQLKQAILSVIDSWSTKSAVSYRDHLQIADEWGTAVVVQKMILGNLSANAGTGVRIYKQPIQREIGNQSLWRLCHLQSGGGCGFRPGKHPAHHRASEKAVQPGFQHLSGVGVPGYL